MIVVVEVDVEELEEMEVVVGSTVVDTVVETVVGIVV